jgi:NAD(P)-dependent dehydrogenase (short-subunit alcohol dehydrogenase family)
MLRRGFRGTSVVITGASSGIGRAAAMAFAGRGASVTLAARREAVSREAVAACEGQGGNALAVPTDVGPIAAGLAALLLAPRAARGAGG